MEDTKRSECLILLVGSNPFPNYIAAMAFKPKGILFVYSKETETIKDGLEDILKKMQWFEGGSFNNLCLQDASDPHEIKCCLENSSHSEIFGSGDTHFHYTGGTKAMAAHCLKYFYEMQRKNGLNPSINSSYLDDSSGCIRFDDGRPPLELEPMALSTSLDNILAMHGIKTRFKPFFKKSKDAEDFSLGDKKFQTFKLSELNLEKDVKNALAAHYLVAKEGKGFKENDVYWKNYDFSWLDSFAKRVLADPYECSSQLWKLREFIVANKPNSVSSADLSLFKDLPGEFDTSNGQKKEEWADFFGGVWLEIWLERLIAKISIETGKPVFNEIHQSVHCHHQDFPLFDPEIDICLLKGQKFYAISVTTDSGLPRDCKNNESLPKLDLHLCKHKLFEISVRARQLGGDHARPALVCFVDGVNNKNNSYIDILEQCMASHFTPNDRSAPNRPKVFGLSDLRNWAGIKPDGSFKEPDLTSLKKFLELKED